MALQFGWAIPTRMFAVPVDNCALHGIISCSILTLASGGEKGTVGYIIGRQRIPHKNNVVRLHSDGPQVAPNFLNERWRWGFERTLHHRLRMMRVGQRSAMEACSGIYHAFFPLGALRWIDPIRRHSRIKGLQRRWQEQSGIIKVPVISVVRGKFAAIGTFPPA